MTLFDLPWCRVDLSSPDEFFSYVEDHEADNLCVWQGELYLEMHNATYTTQARVGLAALLYYLVFTSNHYLSPTITVLCMLNRLICQLFL